MFTPSEFFAFNPTVDPQLFNIPTGTRANTDERAVNLINAFVQAALVDFADITGETLTTTPPETEATRREAFSCLLTAAAIRAKKRMTALDAVKAHNPDAAQFPMATLDLVRVIGRAERADVQRARRLLRGQRWLAQLVNPRDGR